MATPKTRKKRDPEPQPWYERAKAYALSPEGRATARIVLALVLQALRKIPHPASRLVGYVAGALLALEAGSDIHAVLEDTLPRVDRYLRTNQGQYPWLKEVREALKMLTALVNGRTERLAA